MVRRNLVIGLRDALGVEVAANLAEDVIVAGFLEIGDDDLLGVGVGLRARHPELRRRPQAEQLVAARVRLEAQLFVMGELLLETFLAFVERGHACLAVSGATPQTAIHYTPMHRARPCIAGHDGQGNRWAW